MTTLLQEAVHNAPTFEKVAEYELPKNVSEWNDEILQQFYSDVNYLPKEIGADVVINNVDENKGYAKGSIVAFYSGKKINFPVIVNDFKLSPFDVFIHTDNGKTIYYPANLSNVKRALSSEKIGELENYWGKGGPISGVKSTGGVYPKQSVNIWETSPDRLYPTFSKMSKWNQFAKKEDLEKLAIQMEAQPDVGASFVENTGDLVANVIDLQNNNQKVVGDDHKEGILDLKNVVKAKQAVTAIDSQFLDTDKLIPIKAPAVCEVRLYEYPSMEDFLESGKDMAARFRATKVGKPLSGIVLDYKDENDYNFKAGYDQPVAAEIGGGSEDPKRMRNKRPQVFISSDGKYYSVCRDYDKTGIAFYGTNTLNTKGAVGKVVGMISNNTSDDFINQNKENRNDGSDKLFAHIGEMEQGLKENTHEYGRSEWRMSMFILFGAGDAWESCKFRGNYKKYVVNNSNCYVSKDIGIIPANVASVQKVSSVKDPVYKMVMGNVSNIYLIPEGSIVINTEYMRELEHDDFMKPSKPIQKNFEDAAISKVAVCLAPISDDTLGYKITGAPFEPLKKIAGVGDGAISTEDTLTSLQIMGMTKEASTEMLKVAVNRFSDKDVSDKTVTVYGVRDDYINGGVFDESEKTARLNQYIKEYAYGLRRDLVKEASVLQDPDSVDVVLSLNFINEDSLAGYIENIQEMKRIQSDMVEMLIASRMGLSDLNESALKKSIEGLQGVIKGLDELKIATSQEQ
jgi:hypothetical protein